MKTLILEDDEILAGWLSEYVQHHMKIPTLFAQTAEQVLVYIKNDPQIKTLLIGYDISRQQDPDLSENVRTLRPDIKQLSVGSMTLDSITIVNNKILLITLPELIRCLSTIYSVGSGTEKRTGL